VGFTDFTAAVTIDEYGAPFVGMITDEQFDEPSLSEYTTADPTSACADHLTFDEATRSFICRRYAQPCEVDRDLNFGLLSSVKCTMCNVTFHRHRIPRQWRLSRLWTADPTILPREQQSSYEPPPPALNNAPAADTQHARISATTDMNSDIPDHEVTCAHMYSNSSILNPPDRLLPINQTALTMLLDDVLNHGTSELESRFEALLVGLAEERKQIFRARLMNRKRLHASRTQGKSVPSPAADTPVVTPTTSPTAVQPTPAEIANITQQLKSIHIAGGAATSSAASPQAGTTSPKPAASISVPPLKAAHQPASDASTAASDELFNACTSRRERCLGCPSRRLADTSR
jgi:hypothetical protein